MRIYLLTMLLVLLVPASGFAQDTNVTRYESHRALKKAFGKTITDALKSFDFDDKVLVAPVPNNDATEIRLVELDDDGRAVYAPTLSINVFVARTDGEVTVSVEHGHGPCVTGMRMRQEWYDNCGVEAEKTRLELQKVMWFVVLERDGLGDVLQHETVLPPPP